MTKLIGEGDLQLVQQTAVDLCECFGVVQQENVAIEEMGELISVLCRARRNNRTVAPSEIQSEVVDVLLLTCCLATCYNVNSEMVVLKTTKAQKFIEQHKQKQQEQKAWIGPLWWKRFATYARKTISNLIG